MLLIWTNFFFFLYERDFTASIADDNGAITSVHRLPFAQTRKCGLRWMGDSILIGYFILPINHAKCYLFFLRIIHVSMEVLLFNNLHACMGRMGATIFFILIIVKWGFQCNAGWERFTYYNYQYDDPSRFSNCIVLYKMLAINRYQKTFIEFINIQNCIRENYLNKLFIHSRYEFQH